MMMRPILFSLAFLFLSLYSSYGQSPVYYFTATYDSTIESNSYHIAGYVKTNTAPTIADSITIRLRSGSPRATHMDTSSRYILNFAAGEDSLPFVIHISQDTFPEYREHVIFTLSDAVNGSSIGADSSLLFVLTDTTHGATISFIADSFSHYEDADSFANGVYLPFNDPYYVGIRVDNPNPFYVRYNVDNLDCYRNGGFSYLNACGFTNFYFNGEDCYAPPGTSIYYKRGNVVNENMTSDKYFFCVLRNIDANIIPDSLAFFTIKHVNFFSPPSLSFDQSGLTIIGDSLPSSIKLPVTIVNPNMKPLYFRIDTVQTSSTYPGVNYSFYNQKYGYGNGISHDTFTVNFTSSHRSGDTISILFALRNDSINSSPDTLFHVTVIDTGGLTVSFLGAGLAHLKSDSVGYVKVYTSSIAKYPITAKVSYLNGSAVRGTDFIFNDTTVTFPAYAFDTISLPVVMLQDHLYQGNTQVNLQLTNVNPSTVQYDIVQYTYTIIDNVDSGLTPLGITAAGEAQNIKVYPNPFEEKIHIETSLTDYNVTLTNSIGETVFDENKLNGSSDIHPANLPSGLYLLKLNHQGDSHIRKIQKL